MQFEMLSVSLGLVRGAESMDTPQGSSDLKQACGGKAYKAFVRHYDEAYDKT